MSEHTPGPYRRHDMEQHVIVAGMPGGEVASTENGFGDRDANRDFFILAANCHNDMLAALELTERSELEHSNCTECEGEGQAEECDVCFPRADDARLSRRAAIAKATKGSPQ